MGKPPGSGTGIQLWNERNQVTEHPAQRAGNGTWNEREKALVRWSFNGAEVKPSLHKKDMTNCCNRKPKPFPPRRTQVPTFDIDTSSFALQAQFDPSCSPQLGGLHPI
jgi:hypothetical protein